MKSYPSWTVVLTSTAVLGMLVVAACAGYWHTQGGRWFITTSPSMGQELPVGTFLATRPSSVAATSVGDIVTFRSPGSGVVFTHRVVGKAAGGLETRGDVNGVPDAWIITDRELIGAPAWDAPVLGWVARGLPLLLMGMGVIHVLTRKMPEVRQRSLRILGGSVVLGLVGWWLSPWVGMSRLDQAEPPGGEKGVLMNVISTGLLPIRAFEVGGPAVVHLSDGEVGQLHLTSGADSGTFDVSAALDLPWWGWALLVLLCLSPMWCSLVGDYRAHRPSTDDDDDSRIGRAPAPQTIGAS